MIAFRKRHNHEKSLPFLLFCAAVVTLPAGAFDSVASLLSLLSLLPGHYYLTLQVVENALVVADARSGLRGTCKIWRVRQERRWTRRMLVYWALVTLGPLLVGISLTVTSQVFFATSGVVGAVPFLGAVFYTLVSVTLTMSAAAR